MADRTTLADWLAANTDDSDLGVALAQTLGALGEAAARIGHLTRTGPLLPHPDDPLSIRTAIDGQANAILIDTARSAPVAHYASEDLDDVVIMDDGAPLALAVDPLDGASSIDGNASTGTIFSLFPRAESPEASFLRPGDEQIAAGYVMHGPATLLVLTLGAGTSVFTLDPDSAAFILTQTALTTPEDAAAYAINAANYRHWDAPVRAYIDDCVEGAAGPRGKEFKMRWVASLVAETHRILTLGGVFLYPRDDRPGHEAGTLRHVFDVAPIAFVTEQAGGGAIDGTGRVLERVPRGLHARAPLVFGSREKVRRVQRYHTDPESFSSAAPLFGTRGLFRA
ncbi:class 1 fructose-bisphosphatase [Roseospira visakhapatnamensis]|uniref:Fructose-1,6-bisphosphatase class 1 n=1 Tax=Roseospira visakhapatnamensis TaxID=390880 RepID=A0A7W6RG69_9PROT|nr:class 1 fructose-bisphosphatase [Roseospira visakhapatnamensis]MBB4267391.1 fructose-1,6-bisphosphatase I [Roseospira visakhapatnamensis]